MPTDKLLSLHNLQSKPDPKLELGGPSRGMKSKVGAFCDARQACELLNPGETFGFIGYRHLQTRSLEEAEHRGRGLGRVFLWRCDGG